MAAVIAAVQPLLPPVFTAWTSTSYDVLAVRPVIVADVPLILLIVVQAFAACGDQRTE